MAMRQNCPSITVCVSTFDRPEIVGQAIDSVLDQDDPSLSVVVVNQGDPATTSTLLDLYGSQSVSVIDAQPHGLSMSRNVAIQNTTSTWIAFLDEDDVLLPGWSKIFRRHMNAGVGLISCSAELRSGSGETPRIVRANTPVALVESVDGLHMAGCFLVRRELIEAAGGYLPGLNTAHQGELWCRVCSESGARGMKVVADDEVGTAITREAPHRRRLANPRTEYEGSRWILARHQTHLRRDHRRLADIQSIIAVSAAKLGNYPEARRWSFEALKANPSVPKRWLRVFGSAVPPIARKVWGDASAFEYRDESQTIELVASLAADLPEKRDDLLFLPWKYATNLPSSSDRDGTPFWGEAVNDVRFQVPVYRWVASLLRTGRVSEPVLDIGCGSGEKLMSHIAPIAKDYLGIDQPSGIAAATAKFPDGHWEAVDLSAEISEDPVAGQGARLVICADVIEHVDDPHRLLAFLRSMIGPTGHAVISTPDRGRLEKATALGPPPNRRHIREWNAEEFKLLLSSHGLEVVQARHLLPRSYSATVLDAKITLHRLLHGRAVPGRRSCMAYLVRLGPTHSHQVTRPI